MIYWMQHMDQYLQEVILDNKNIIFDQWFDFIRTVGYGQIVIPCLILLLIKIKYDIKPLLLDSIIIGILVLFLNCIFHKTRPAFGSYLFLGPSSLSDYDFLSFISPEVCVSVIFCFYMKDFLDKNLLAFITISVAYGQLYFNHYWVSDIIISYLLMYLYFFYFQLKLMRRAFLF